MADVILQIGSKELREMFDESTLSDEKPTDGEYEDFMKYLKENQKDAFKGMMLDFWCQYIGRM